MRLYNFFLLNAWENNYYQTANNKKSCKIVDPVIPQNRLKHHRLQKTIILVGICWTIIIVKLLLENRLSYTSTPLLPFESLDIALVHLGCRYLHLGYDIGQLTLKHISPFDCYIFLIAIEWLSKLSYFLHSRIFEILFYFITHSVQFACKMAIVNHNLNIRSILLMKTH